jgi:hypothetical protein
LPIAVRMEQALRVVFEREALPKTVEMPRRRMWGW